jgi:hypothetical protein
MAGMADVTAEPRGASSTKAPRSAPEGGQESAAPPSLLGLSKGAGATSDGVIRRRRPNGRSRAPTSSPTRGRPPYPTAVPETWASDARDSRDETVALGNDGCGPLSVRKGEPAPPARGFGRRPAPSVCARTSTHLYARGGTDAARSRAAPGCRPPPTERWTRVGLRAPEAQIAEAGRALPRPGRQGRAQARSRRSTKRRHQQEQPDTNHG